MTYTMIALVLLAVALALVVGSATHLTLTVVRSRRRASWALDRAEWRRWIGRP